VDVPLSDDVVSGIVIGKLPFHGDFVARGLSGGERHKIDQWLTASMAAARDQFGSGFDEIFDRTPPWRFAWRDDQWTAGALAPSIDSTGRKFPLLVALCNLAEGQVKAAARLCEDAASEAIALGWGADQLLEAIAAATITPDESPAVEGWWNEDLGGAGGLQGRVPPSIMSHMLAATTRAAV
jgi:type VI secretion system protein ImpM